LPALSPWRPLSNAGHPVSRTAWQGTTGHSTQPGTVSLQPQPSPNELCIGMLSSGGADTFSPTRLRRLNFERPVHEVAVRRFLPYKP
jgi:hypothetical protein